MKPTTAILAVVFLTALYGTNDAELKILNPTDHLDPDANRNVMELISSKGYPAENHTVHTSDGFILTVHRIPYGRNGNDDSVHRPVVLVQHGLMGASFYWVINFPNQSLGFILADANYDVWLGNSRGNLYSRHHVKYTPEMKEFWNFSFDEMAIYDLPATMDYILNATGENQLYYIGYSQGTSSMFALLSQTRKYNRRIKLYIALAPVAFGGHITNILRLLSPTSDVTEFLLENAGVNEFKPSNTFMKTLGELVCSSEVREICANVIFLIFGFDRAQLNETRLGVYAGHFPGGSSTRSVNHFLQLAKSKRFCKYDHGKETNMQIYKRPTPPDYRLSRVTLPVAIISAMNDNGADTEDVNLLKQKLPNLVDSYIVPWKDFTHTDFTLALDAKSLVYDKCLSLLSQH